MRYKKLEIFTDGSFDPKTRIGISGYLLISPTKREEFFEDLSIVPVKTKMFRDTNCIRVEFLSIILALNQVVKTAGPRYPEIIIYSDCKTACDLPSRRERLEKMQFKSGKSKQLLANADLYRRIFNLFDQLKPEIIWVKGHKPSQGKNRIEQVFSHVDKTTRRILRQVR